MDDILHSPSGGVVKPVESGGIKKQVQFAQHAVTPDQKKAESFLAAHRKHEEGEEYKHVQHAHEESLEDLGKEELSRLDTTLKVKDMDKVSDISDKDTEESLDALLAQLNALDEEKPQPVKLPSPAKEGTGLQEKTMVLKVNTDNGGKDYLSQLNQLQAQLQLKKEVNARGVDPSWVTYSASLRSGQTEERVSFKISQQGQIHIEALPSQEKNLTQFAEKLVKAFILIHSEVQTKKATPEYKKLVAREEFPSLQVQQGGHPEMVKFAEILATKATQWGMTVSHEKEDREGETRGMHH